MQRQRLRIQVELDAGMNLHFAVQIAVSRNDLPCLPENFKGLEAVWKQDEYGSVQILSVEGWQH